MGKRKESTRLAHSIKTPLQLPDTKMDELQSSEGCLMYKNPFEVCSHQGIIDQSLYFVL